MGLADAWISFGNIAAATCQEMYRSKEPLLVKRLGLDLGESGLKGRWKEVPGWSSEWQP